MSSINEIQLTAALIELFNRLGIVSEEDMIASVLLDELVGVYRDKTRD